MREPNKREEVPAEVASWIVHDYGDLDYFLRHALDDEDHRVILDCIVESELWKCNVKPSWEEVNDVIVSLYETYAKDSPEEILGAKAMLLGLDPKVLKFYLNEEM